MTKVNKLSLKKWLLILAAFLIVLIFCVWPTNYIIEAPGQANPVSSLIKQNKKTNYHNLYFVTVSERPAIMIDYLTSFLRPYDTRYTRQEVMGESSSQEYNQMQKYYMETSQNNALYYAAKRAKVPHRQKYLGVYVMNILPGSSFKNKLKVGDTIKEVNGRQFNSTKELMNYLNTLSVHERITIKVLRNHHSSLLKGKTMHLTGTKRVGIGIQLVDHTEVITKPKIKIDAGNIGGPSAGLMFSLAAYQIFTHHQLTAAKIAGTGTIDEEGHVGIIGGVDKKVVAADKEGMKVFFAPTDQPTGVKKSETNYVEAKKTADKLQTKMKIVPVKNFDDALNYLKQHPSLKD